MFIVYIVCIYYILYIYTYIYIKYNLDIFKGFRASKNQNFPTSFDHGRFQGKFLKF